jgi:phage terminase large subunit-like protein
MTSPQRKKKAPAGSSDDPVAAYAKAVGAGTIIAGPLVRAACARHLADLRDGAQRGLVFDKSKSMRAIEFFAEVLKLNGGEFEGQPFVLGPWQAFIVGSLFGWVRAADGQRRFRVAYIEIGKGNGKSPLAAGIGLYCLCADEEPRAEVYAAATKKDQAMILFRDAVAMVDQSPELRHRLVKSGGQERCWNLGYIATGSFFRAISSDDGQSGPRPHCSLIDEIHEHKDATVVNMMKAGQKGRRQPLQVEITNSGFDRTTICYEHHEYSDRVVKGLEINDEWFAYVCALDEGEDPLKDEACWPKANPNLGVSIQFEYLRGEVREARGMPAKASKVKRLNFCQWVDAENPWIDGPSWMACEDDFDVFDVLRDAEEVVGALDLSGTSDLTALALAGKVGGEIVACVEFFTPRETLSDRAKKDKVPYQLWVDQGHMHATPGRAVDYSFVAERLAELQVELPLTRVGFDPYRIKYLERELDQAGIEIELIEHPQGYYKVQQKKDAKGNDLPALWMPRSIELLEKAIGAANPAHAADDVASGTAASPRLRVQRNPVLTWNSASAVLEADPKNNRIFTKRKSRGRIDGLVALAMAVGLLCDDTPAPAPRKYQMLVFG